MGFEKIIRFHEVLEGEIESIKKRRSEVELELQKASQSEADAIRYPTDDSNIVGLALSGGGIRSAAVCLGALQGLNETGVLQRVDYLSTVSGGGYIGTSLSAGLAQTNGAFPFTSRLAVDEVAAVQHLRDYSNYIFPHADYALLHNIAIYARGVLTNLVLLFPFLLLLSSVTLFSNPTKESLTKAKVFFWNVLNLFNFDYFVVTAYLAIVLLVVLVIWSVYRSFRRQQQRPEVPNRFTAVVGLIALGVLFAGFCELQPFILNQMFELPAGHQEGVAGVLAQVVDKLAIALAPVAAAVAFLGRKLGEFIKSATESASSQKRHLIAAYAGKALIYIAALFVPFLLWAVYLQLSYWGICQVTEHCTVPKWIAAAPRYVDYVASHLWHKDTVAHGVAWAYVAVAAALLLLSLFLRPNANSLHPLYRDRLGKAFLFKMPVGVWSGAPLEPLPPENRKLSSLSEKHAPYHLINAALNIQSSKVANRRGRNADFFIFSRNFIGSRTTGYVATSEMENAMPELDLATAMAVSGAAASSEMGAETIKPLTPTLAVLNIRLGYWLRNPAWEQLWIRLARKLKLMRLAALGNRAAWLQKGWNPFANFYFLLEIFGLLNEKKKSIYLTDGGHIENLGLYQLLKRRCKVIVVIDAEADSEMAFGSFVTLQRYARIDLGILIDLPWQQISKTTKRVGKNIDDTGDSTKSPGPHCAIGEIRYPNDRSGVLVYIKASLTGDEPDYVFHYKKKYSAFPHETTLDQLFTEEQFEVYRALGFHMAFRLFDGWDDFAHVDAGQSPGVVGDLNLLDQLFPRRAAQAATKSFAERL